MSDPHAKRWLADDPSFLASLNDLDRGLADGEDELGELGDVGEFGEDVAAAPPPIPPPPAPAPRPATITAPAASRSGSRTINAARALDPSRLLDTTPPPRPPRTPAPAPPVAAVRPAPPLIPLGTFGEAADAAVPPPPLAFARPAPSEPRARRPLLDLFPPSALEPERPPSPALGTAVGPQLPPRRSRPASPPPDAAPSPLDALTYETFYGLREKPFSLSTDPRFLYQSAAYERASQDVLGAIRTRGGPVVLTAPLGMGKTTLCRSLLAEFDRRTVSSLVLEPQQSLDDVIGTMLVDFGVIAPEDLAAAAHRSREQLIATLHQFLEALVPLQASAVLFIDEAQNAPVTLLGDLAVLLGAPAARVIQLVLVGQPSLTALLKHPDLRALNASVARRTELGPLAADEINSYVMHRVSIAGANTRIEFDDEAIARLFELSDGAPRLVNVLCDRAMSRGQAVSAAVIDRELIDAAAADLDLQVSAGDGPGLLASIGLIALFALLTLAGAAAALWVSRDAVARTIQQWEQVPLAPGGPIRRLPVPLAPIPPPADVP